MRCVPLAAVMTIAGLFSVGDAYAGVTTVGVASPDQSAGDQQIRDVRNQSVARRQRPGYDALGVRAGSFVVYPTLAVSEDYNDNIYAVNSGKTDDFITTVSPAVLINSDWNRHALSFHGGLDYSRYWDNTSENNTNWNVGTAGRLDILRDLNIAADASYSQNHEDRGTSTFLGGGAEPTEYKLFDSNVTLNKRFNQLIFALGGSYTDYNYNDTPAVGGGTIDQDFRDRHIFGGVARAGYAVSPDTNIYLQGRLNKREYRLQPPVVALDRDSKGYSLVVGSEFLISRLVQGSVEIGYQSQDYNAGPTVKGLSYAASADWFVTPLTTVRFSANSTIDETDSTLATGALDQQVGLGVDHELMRNVILSGDVSYQNVDFKGTPRQDKYLRAGIGANYLLNRYLGLALQYNYTDRNSNVFGLDYKQNVIGLTLRGQL